MKCRLLVRALSWLLLLLATPAAADEFRPAYLQITQTGPGAYDVLWKAPALDENTVIKVRPAFPAEVRSLGVPRRSYAAGMVTERWRITVPGGLDSHTIQFPGLAESRIDVLVRLAGADGTVQLDRILASDPIFVVKTTPGAAEVARTYIMLGIEHILIGFDHLCFVLALLMIVGFNRRLIWTVSAFTLAHSITLSLATLGVIHVPGPPVEAIIALSIVFVSSEIVQKQRGREGLASTKPWLVAFIFGLLHGLGFAGALDQIGLPANAIPLALLFFNIGVEIGQLLFIGGVVALTRLAKRVANDRFDLARLSEVPAYLIGGVASYWVIERISNFSS